MTADWTWWTGNGPRIVLRCFKPLVKVNVYLLRLVTSDFNFSMHRDEHHSHCGLFVGIYWMHLRIRNYWTQCTIDEEVITKISITFNTKIHKRLIHTHEYVHIIYKVILYFFKTQMSVIFRTHKSVKIEYSNSKPVQWKTENLHRV